MWRLSHTIKEDSPCWPCRPSFALPVIVEESGWLIQKLEAALCAGTHLDAPKHCLGSETVESFPEEAWIRTYVFRLKKAPTAQTVITRAQLEEWWRALEKPDTKGCWLLVQTGWGSLFSDRAIYRGTEECPGDFPYLEASCGAWILERGFMGLGVDTLSPDYKNAFPIHEALLGTGRWIVENLKYEPDLPTICEILVSPTRWTGATEASTTVMARPLGNES